MQKVAFHRREEKAKREKKMKETEKAFATVILFNISTCVMSYIFFFLRWKMKFKAPSETWKRALCYIWGDFSAFFFSFVAFLSTRCYSDCEAFMRMCSLSMHCGFDLVMLSPLSRVSACFRSIFTKMRVTMLPMICLRWKLYIEQWAI